MESRRICRLLIVIFVVLIVMFSLLYRKEESKQTVLSPEFIGEAVENLSSDGIVISTEAIVGEIPETDIYCLEENLSDSFYDSISSTLVPCVFGSNVSTTQFDTPKGTTLGIYAAEGDESELGRLVFPENEYSFSLSRKGVAMSGGEDPIAGFDEDTVSEAALDKINEIAEGLNSKSRFGYKVSGTTFDGNYLIVTVNQTISGYDIDGIYMNIVFENDSVIIVSGKWITSSAKAEYHNKLTDGVNVLYNLDFEDVTEIHGERIVYSLRSADNERMFLLPRWEISYSDKNENLRKAYFDAV